MKKTKKIILLGGGGHSRALIGLLSYLRTYTVVGILEPSLPKGTKLDGIPVLGGDEMLAPLRKRGISHACVAVGETGKDSLRHRLFNQAFARGFEIPALVHPKSLLGSKNIIISQGAQIMLGALVQPGVRIGANAIVNTGAIIDHDCRIGDHVHVAPGAILCGNVSLGAFTMVGAGSIIIPNIKVGPEVMIGAGSVVVRDVERKKKVKGVPAR